MKYHLAADEQTCFGAFRLLAELICTPDRVGGGAEHGYYDEYLREDSEFTKQTIFDGIKYVFCTFELALELRVDNT